MVERDETSEFLLAAMSVFTFLVLMVCPGMFFAFFLPGWLGFPLMMACGCVGPWIMWTVDASLYGDRA